MLICEADDLRIFISTEKEILPVFFQQSPIHVLVDVLNSVPFTRVLTNIYRRT